MVLLAQQEGAAGAAEARALDKFPHAIADVSAGLRAAEAVATGSSYECESGDEGICNAFRFARTTELKLKGPGNVHNAHMHVCTAT